MTPARLARLQAILRRRQPDLTVVTDEVHKGRNIAAITRSCDAVGVDTLYTVRPEAGFKPFRGTALGAHKWVQVRLFERVEQPLTELREAGFQVVVTRPSGDSRPYWEVDYTRPTALVVGSERDGVSGRAQSLADCAVHIPMYGMSDSFNVSAACAIVLAEAARQRAAAGMYDQSRLSEATYRERFFQWAHPVVAAYCDERGLAYPEVDTEGEIIDPAAWYRQVRTAGGEVS